MISNKVLAKVAVFGGFITLSSGLYVNWKIQDRVRSSDYFKQAMQYIRTHHGAVTLFGEPIKVGNVDLGNTNANFCDGHSAQFEVPVIGPHGKGTVYFWATRKDNELSWNVQRIEFSLKADESRRFTIKQESVEAT